MTRSVAEPTEIRYVTADSAIRMVWIALLVGFLVGTAVGVVGVTLGFVSSMEERN